MEEPPDLINPNPVLHERKARKPSGAQQRAASGGALGREPIDAQEVYDHVRDVTDPEHPYTLEQLNVVAEDLIQVDDAHGTVRCVAGGRTHEGLGGGGGLDREGAAREVGWCGVSKGERVD